MAYKARYIAAGDSIDYTPVSDVSAGDVIVIGNVVHIAKLDIPAGVKGALPTGGLFQVAIVSGSVTAGQDLYWDVDGDPENSEYGEAGSGAFTTDSTKGPYAGYAVEDDDGDGSVLMYLRSRDSAVTLARSAIVQEDNVPYSIPFTAMRVHDDFTSLLPDTATGDDMALVTGTPGTDAPTLQGVDFGGTTSDEKCAFEFVLPPEYVSGQSITVRAHAGMLTTVADTSATLDCEAYLDEGDGSVGSDLCATAAQSINSLTLADKDFTITPTGLAPGDKLIIRLSFAGTDAGNVGVMIPVITAVAVLLDIKG